MKANSEKTKQSKKATRRVLAGVLCGASVLSLVLSLVMPPISQAIANDAEAGAAEETVAAADSSSESTDVENTSTGIPRTRIVTTLRVAREKTPLPQGCRPTTRRSRVTRSLPTHSLRMMKITMTTQSPLPASVTMTISR